MPATNILANMFVTLYNTEARRKSDCLVYPTSKLGVEVLKTLQKDGYIGEFEHVEDKRGGADTIKVFQQDDGAVVLGASEVGVGQLEAGYQRAIDPGRRGRLAPAANLNTLRRRGRDLPAKSQYHQ